MDTVHWFPPSTHFTFAKRSGTWCEWPPDAHKSGLRHWGSDFQSVL